MNRLEPARSRRLTGSEVHARLQVLARRLEQRPLYANEEAELRALLAGTFRKPVHLPTPRRVTPFRRGARP